VYSIDEVDRGTPTKAPNMIRDVERSADFSSHVGIGQDCLLGNHGFLVA
jgi:hypothetical protein